MTLLLNATITTPTKTLKVNEALDVGANLFFVENNNLFRVKKGKNTSVVFEDSTGVFDNSLYIGKRDILLG